MYRLEFINFLGDHRLVGYFNSSQEADAAMVKELHSRGIKPYYYRSWGDEIAQTIDYGSHNEFYKIYNEDKENE